MSKQPPPKKQPEAVPIQSHKAPKVTHLEVDRFIEPLSHNGVQGYRVEAAKGYRIDPCELGYRIHLKDKYVCTVPHARVVFVLEDV